MAQVNIAGLDKVEVLRALWTKSGSSEVSQRVKSQWGAPSVFDWNAACAEVQSYVDYFQGRVIKCNLKGDSFDPAMFDRDNGAGAAAAAVATLVRC